MASGWSGPHEAARWKIRDARPVFIRIFLAFHWVIRTLAFPISNRVESDHHCEMILFSSRDLS